MSGSGNGNGKINGRANRELMRQALNGPHRRHRRYLTQSLLVDNPVEGRVVNIGKAGFALEALEGLSVGHTYLFKIRLGDKHLRLSGRVQWCRLTGTESNGDAEAKPVYKAGVALIETVASKAWQEALQRLTEDPAYVIWHKARKGVDEAPADLTADKVIKLRSERSASGA